ncbi:MAG: flavin reductase [Clostridia bacterium]|nr:flavin reductase [Clostridia bacterium]
MELREISPYELQYSNAFRAVGKEWMLICAEDANGINAMTASWGFLGQLWNRPAAICFIRPQRFTYHMADGSERFSLCFFGDGYRKELGYFGTASGRDGDKSAATGMHYGHIESVPVVEESNLILLCRKLYVDDIKEGNFKDTSLIDTCYPERDFHRVFVCEVEKCFVRQ